MTSPKVAKILRRTLVGGSLATTIGLALWWTSRSAHGEPIFYVTALALLAAVVEVARMGRFAGRTLLPVLLVAAVGALLLAWSAIASERLGDRFPAHLTSGSAGYRADLAIACAWTLALSAAAAGALHAFGRVLPKSGAVARGLLYLGFCALFVFVFRDEWNVAVHLRPAFVVLAILVVTTLPLDALDRAWTSVALAVGLALWLVPPLPALWQVWSQWGTGGLVALLVLSKVGDTAGYYVGSAIGRTHPFPGISPGKTTAGCVASLVVATAVGGALAASGVLPEARLGVLAGLLAGALVNVAAQAGDLFESWVKRRTGVKDSSSVFGPSGGVLDQIDSLLFSVPVALVTWPLLFS